MDIGLITVLIVFFLLTPHIPDTVLYKVDHPVIRAALILLVFGSLYAGPAESIMMLLAVGSLFLERNTRKFRRALEAGGSNEVPASFIESTMSPDKRAWTTGPSISTHSYIESPQCEMESPIGDHNAAVGEKPVHETAEGDSTGLATLEEIAKSFV